MLYIICDATSGAQRRVFREEAAAQDAMQAGDILVVDTERDSEPDPLFWRWNTVALAYEAYSSVGEGPVSRTRGTKLEFRRKIGFARESQLHQLRRKSQLPDQLYGDITTMIEWLNSATSVILTDPETISQSHTLGALFSNAGLMAMIGVPPLTTEERDAYVASLLAPWTTVGE